jgi:hypothetical protein
MKINLSVGHEGDIRRYRMDTTKAERVRFFLDGAAGTPEPKDMTDGQVRDEINRAVSMLYPLPYNRHSRAFALWVLAEAEKRGMTQPDLSFTFEGMGKVRRTHDG